MINLQDFQQENIIKSYTSYLREILHTPTGIQHLLRIQNYKKSSKKQKLLQTIINSIQYSHSEHLLIPKQWTLHDTLDQFTNKKRFSLTSISLKAKCTLDSQIKLNIKHCYIPQLRDVVNIFLPIAEGIKTILEIKISSFIKIKPQNILRLNEDSSWVLDPTTINLTSTTKFCTEEILYFPPQILVDGIKKYKKEAIYIYAFSMCLLQYISSYAIFEIQNLETPEDLDDLFLRINNIDLSPELLDLLKINILQWPNKCCKIDQLILLLKQNKKYSGYVDLQKYSPEKIKSHIDIIYDQLQHGDLITTVDKLRDVTDEIYFVENKLDKEWLTQDIVNIIISTIAYCKEELQAQDLINMIYKISPVPTLEHSEAHFTFGNLLCGFYDYAQAIEQYNISLQIRLENSAEKTLRTGDLYYNIGVSKMCQKELEGALDFFTKALKIRVFLFGTSTEIVADTYHNIAYVNGELKRYLTSLMYYLKAKSIRMKINGKIHEKTGDAIYNIGWTYIQMNNQDLAQHNLEESLKIRMQIPNVPIEKFADIYHNLGLVLFQKQEYDFALEKFQESIKIQEENFFGATQRLALGYQSIGECYFKIRRYSEARASYAQSIDIQKALGQEDTEEIESLLQDCDELIKTELKAV